MLALNAVIPISVKHAMAQVGKVVWAITMTTMEQESIRFLVEIAVMGIQKEMEFAIFANKNQVKCNFLSNRNIKKYTKIKLNL